MKPIKMRGLATLAALTAMAFVGASSAMAGSTSLCEVEESPCASGNRITHAHYESLDHIFYLSFVTAECESLFLGDALNSGLGAPVIFHGNYTYVCLEECTMTEENGPGLMEFLRTASELAVAGYRVLVHVVCGLNCRYDGEGLTAHALGPLLSGMLRGEVVLEEQEVHKESGLFCPSTGNLDFLVEPLVHTYIST